MISEAPAPLGLGTYRLRPPAVQEAVLRAANDPRTAWVDTAPNYLGGRAQSLLAPALADRVIKVSTKVGFVAQGAGTTAIVAGALSAAEAASGHCLSARFVHWQCAQNRAELGRPRLNLVFAHNPERTAGDPNEALLRAFTALEEEVSAGTLDAYGVATWDGFDNGALSVPNLDRMASLAAGSEYHHLRAVQLPVSLVTANAFTQALDNRGPIAQAAARGWDVFASAPLFGGELPQLATRELADLIRPDLSVTQACLLAVASCPGVTRVLLSASSSAHWHEPHAALREPLVPVATLRKVLDVLASD
ncbi:aldo/keto reductase [Streptomyces buecherae]|uniref:aldo/keto reductase n=1 Tax=Streptomyces buecherae TaxID=2763006 RepID=UPI001E4902AE|nr:aldo/keto reductase [Streptomyces buecherae]